jgi:Bardet-Biedl syndrome 9 protein
MSLFRTREWWVRRVGTPSEKPWKPARARSFTPSPVVVRSHAIVYSPCRLSTLSCRWACPSDADEEYDTGCLVVANIDNAADGDGAWLLRARARMLLSPTSHPPTPDSQPPNPQPRADKIVTGSFSGTLRIYRPSSPSIRRASSASSEAVSSSSSAADLLLETRLSLPILQLAAGTFLLPNSPALALAVLHPSKVVVYLVTTGEGNATALADLGGGGGGEVSAALAGVGAQCRIVRQFEHALTGPGLSSFTACNMCVGAFGAVGTRGSASSSMFGPQSSSSSFPTSIAVQSMDGQIAVFEGASVGPRRQLDGILLPGPLSFVPRTDTFVTVASDLTVVGYRWSGLLGGGGGGGGGGALGAAAAARPSAADGKDASESGPRGAPVRPEWSINVGETASYLHVGRYATGTIEAAGLSGGSSGPAAAAGGNPLFAPVDLVLVGDRTLFTLRDGASSSSSSSSSAGGSSSSSSSSSGGSGAVYVPPSSSASSAGIRAMKRLDYNPVASCLYPRSGTSSSLSQLGRSSDAGGSASAAAAAAVAAGHNLMVAGANGMLLVYREDALVWSARAPFAPAALAVGRFAGQAGLTVLLSARGDLCVAYLGTEPPTGALVQAEASASSSAATDPSSMDGEYRRLLAIIKDAAAARAASEPKDTLTIVGAIPPVLEDAPRPGCGCREGAGVVGGRRGEWWDPEDVEFEADASAPSSSSPAEDFGRNNASSSAGPQWVATARLSVSWSGPVPLQNVTVFVHPPPWARLPVGLRSFTLASVPGQGSEPLQMLLPLRPSGRGIPSSSSLRVVLTFAGEGGETRTATASFPTPLGLACAVVPPVKAATFKATLDTNRPPAPLTSLFPDALRQPPHIVSPDILARVSAGAASVLTFAFPSGADCTILVSKAAGRYRLQSSHMEAVGLVAATLCDRLARYFAPDGPGTAALREEGGKAAGGGDQPFAVTFTEPLPQAELFSTVDEHLAARHALLRSYAALNDRAHEYRLVIKRLLVRFKDRTPAPLNQLDTLMERAQAHVMEAGAEVEAAQAAVAATAAALSGRVSLFLLLVRLAFALDERSAEALAAHLSPLVVDTLAGGWEEATDAALTHFLKTGMRTGGGGGGGAKEAAAALPPADLGGPPVDSTRLRKQVAIVVDRLGKGVGILPLRR